MYGRAWLVGDRYIIRHQHPVAARKAARQMRTLLSIVLSTDTDPLQAFFTIPALAPCIYKYDHRTGRVEERPWTAPHKHLWARPTTITKMRTLLLSTPKCVPKPAAPRTLPHTKGPAIQHMHVVMLAAWFHHDPSGVSGLVPLSQGPTQMRTLLSMGITPA